MNMKPMLAAPADLSAIRYPIYASPKLDGVRAMNHGGTIRSRSLKTFPNAAVQQLFSHPSLAGMDGELIVGSPTAKDVYRVTQSATSNMRGEPEALFYVFDDMSAEGGFAQRHLRLIERVAELAERWPLLGDRVKVLPHKTVNNEPELLEFERHCLELGYEGLILRAPNAPYKHGRSTALEGSMLKLKRFEDSEACILGMEEEMFNGNVATVNALGHTERSNSKAGLSGKGRMGALIVRDLKTGVVFNIGTGFNGRDRELFWRNRESIVSDGWVVKYKSFKIGVKDAPRFPVYLGLRADWDLS